MEWLRSLFQGDRKNNEQTSPFSQVHSLLTSRTRAELRFGFMEVPRSSRKASYKVGVGSHRRARGRLPLHTQGLFPRLFTTVPLGLFGMDGAVENS